MKKFEENFVIESASSSESAIRINHGNSCVIGMIDEKNLILCKDNVAIKKRSLKLYIVAVLYGLLCCGIGKFWWPILIDFFEMFTSPTIAMIWVLGLYIIFGIAFLFVIFIALIANEKFKRNHSVEHMIVDFINTKRRLPKNLEELKAFPHRSIYCGTTGNIIGFISISIEYFIILMLYLLVKMIFSNSIEISSIIEKYESISYIIVFVTVMIIATKSNLNNILFLNMSRKISVFIQKWTTSPNYTDENLVIAYFIAEYWAELFNCELLNDVDTEYWKKLAELYKLNIIK